MRILRAVTRVTPLLALAAACADDPVRVPAADASRRAGDPSFSFGADEQFQAPRVAILDACDPADPAWAPTGGCLLRKGDVTNAEFGALLRSPLYTGLVGHPAWRNEPSYLSVRDGMPIRVTNEGGRPHTFTRVAAFGGGRVPPLNVGVTPAPECQVAPGANDPTQVAPGDMLTVEDLPAGLHRFQCCFHPWMRASIRVNEAH